MAAVERTEQGDQFVLDGFETTDDSRESSIKQQMREVEAKRQAAIRMKDWHCADLLLAEYRRLDGLRDAQKRLFG